MAYLVSTSFTRIHCAFDPSPSRMVKPEVVCMMQHTTMLTLWRRAGGTMSPHSYSWLSLTFLSVSSWRLWISLFSVLIFLAFCPTLSFLTPCSDTLNTRVYITPQVVRVFVVNTPLRDSVTDRGPHQNRGGKQEAREGGKAEVSFQMSFGFLSKKEGEMMVFSWLHKKGKKSHGHN